MAGRWVSRVSRSVEVIRGLAPLCLLSIALSLFTAGPVLGQACGGVERWAVKVGSDAAADQVALQNPISISIKDLNALPDPRCSIPHDDDDLRLDEEKRTYEVKGTLRLFKFEADRDFHLVITDSSLRYSKGGSGSKGKEAGTSFIAEIPDPECFMGKNGQLSKRSVWQGPSRTAPTLLPGPAGRGAQARMPRVKRVGGMRIVATSLRTDDRTPVVTPWELPGSWLWSVPGASFSAEVF